MDDSRLKNLVNFNFVALVGDLTMIRGREVMCEEQQSNRSSGPDSKLASSSEIEIEKNLNEFTQKEQVDQLAKELNINERKLMRKLDIWIVPPFCLLYFLAFLDRVNISNAKLYGLNEDLGLSSHQFNIALTVFFAPYVLFETISNYCLKLVKPHIWLSLCIFFFGIVTIGMGFVTNFGGLVACRFLLGIFESGSFPGIFYCMGSYYTKHEAQRRFSAFFSVTCLAGGCSGALAYRIGRDLEGVHGISAWQYVFIIEGLFTAGLALVLYFTIADFPEEARFLSDNERLFLKKKLEIHSVDSGFELHNTLKDAVKVLADPLVWIVTLAYFGFIVPAYGYAYFAPTIISQMGYTAMEANRHSIYPWLLAFGLSNILSYFSDRMGRRFVFTAACCLIGITGLSIVLGATSNPNARYAGCFLALSGLYSGMPLLVCWASLNFGGHLRKSIGIGSMIGFGNIGGIISSWIFPDQDSPRFIKGASICIAFNVLALLASLAYYLYCQYLNKAKLTDRYQDRFYKQSNEDQVKQGDRNPRFVYGY